jgi:hypothetical protein
VPTLWQAGVSASAAGTRPQFSRRTHPAAVGRPATPLRRQRPGPAGPDGPRDGGMRGTYRVPRRLAAGRRSGALRIAGVSGIPPIRACRCGGPVADQRPGPGPRDWSGVERRDNVSGNDTTLSVRRPEMSVASRACAAGRSVLALATRVPNQLLPLPRSDMTARRCLAAKAATVLADRSWHRPHRAGCCGSPRAVVGTPAPAGAGPDVSAPPALHGPGPGGWNPARLAERVAGGGGPGCSFAGTWPGPGASGQAPRGLVQWRGAHRVRGRRVRRCSGG